MLLLIIVTKMAGIENIYDAITSIDPQFLAIAIALHVAVMLLGAYRWSRLLKILGFSVPVLSTFQFQLIDKVANSFFPTSAMGITARTLMLKQRYGVEHTDGLATIVLDYGFDTFATLFAALPCFLLLYGTMGHLISGAALACIALLSMLFVAVVVINSPQVRKRIHVLEGNNAKRTFIQKLTSHRIGKNVIKFSLSFNAMLSHPAASAKAMAVSIVVKALEALRLYILFLAFGISLPFAYLLLLEVLWVFLKVMMITPGGVGTSETSRIALYSIHPIVTSAVATPIVFIDRFITFWLTLAAGSVTLMLYNRGQDSSEGSSPLRFPSTCEKGIAVKDPE